MAIQKINESQLINGLIKQRQGGTTGAGSWSSAGTSNTDTSTSNVLIQVGQVAVTANPTTVTFPTAYTQVPIVQLTEATANSSNAFCLIVSVSTTQVSIRVINDAGSVVTTESVNWMAVGV